MISPYRCAVAVVCALASLEAGAVGVAGQGTWETTLQARDLNGDGATDAYYDTALHVTWLREANIGGRQTWDAAKAWADQLTFAGYSDWRLPTMVDTGSPGCDWNRGGGTDCGYNVLTKIGTKVYSEMAYLFYQTLGNDSYFAPVTGIGITGPWGLQNTGPMKDLQSFSYWSDLTYSPYTAEAWFFSMSDGGQTSIVKSTPLHAMAVRNGDVSAVPELPAAALLAFGLLVFAGRRFRALPTAGSASFPCRQG